MYRHFFGAVGAIAALAMSACGGGDDPQSSGDSPTTTMTTTPAASSATMAGEQFGAGCALVPKDPANPGSFAAMAQVPVATAASGNPLLSTLVAAVKKANLVDSLNGAQGVTVFAPTNDAFAKIPQDQLDKVLADNAMLTKILTYHVVPGQLAPDQLAGTHRTLQGGQVTVSGGDAQFSVNGAAQVVCGNVTTANATVYIVDSVLMPKG